MSANDAVDGATSSANDLRRLDRHPDTMVTGLIPELSCRACRPHAPLSPTSIAGDNTRGRKRDPR